MPRYFPTHTPHICGLYFLVPNEYGHPTRKYLPQVSLSVHANIIGSTSRTLLTQTFVNPAQDKPVPELRYTFPLYDGVSVVEFVCTINKDRVIRGLVRERAEARRVFQEAVDKGQTAGLLEQLPKASDVFTTTIGNIPAGAEIRVDITYLGELKHDAETDGIRFTIPTVIAPRYGHLPGGELMTATTAPTESGIDIVVDAEMPTGSNIRNIQSPSHPISVTIGSTSRSQGADMSLQKASATLSLGSTVLDKDFVVNVVATNTANPLAVLETHPKIPNQRALMATLVPKFNLPPSRPEIVFVCDRSGSMGGKIPNLKNALNIFLKSLPVGVKFNICSFGSHHEFLFKEGSRSYDASSLEEATRYVARFDSNFGGTEIYRPMEEAFQKRYKDMDLEVFLLTDGEIWRQDELFELINKNVADSNGMVRVFTLGIGNSVSHALIEGVARAGNGFSQTVGDNEKMNTKVVRMLKASLSPHVKDYTMEVKYGNDKVDDSSADDDDFEMVEKVMDALVIDVSEDSKPDVAEKPKATISLFDTSADPDVEMADASLDKSAGGKYSHVPPVAEPKILQAPFNIPPLYPFSRTSVYLLFSPQSPQKPIKSVVLRGTSVHGPLELEIPVTALADKGETIHQLAARKAVKELEEGRGWLFHAKDAKEPEKLLKDKFEGRFSDMVEREAVRLGVGFQVGGKWTSFVAVEGNAEKEEGKQEEEAQEDEEDADIARARYAVAGSPKLKKGFLAGANHSFARRGSRSAVPSAPPPPPSMASPMPAPAPASFGAPGFGPIPFGMQRSASGAATTTTAGGGLFGAATPAQVQAQQQQQVQQQARQQAQQQGLQQFQQQGLQQGSGLSQQDHAMQLALLEQQNKKRLMMARSEGVPAGGPAFGAASANAVFADPLLGRGAPPDQARMSSIGSAARSLFKRKSGGGDDDRRSDRRDRDRDRAGSSDRAFFSAAKEESASPSARNISGDPFELIVALQSFSGSWVWSEQLFGAMRLDKGKLPALEAYGLKTGTDLLATVLVLAFLEERMGDQKDEWEMMADKARDWVGEQLRSGNHGAGGMGVDELVQKAKGVF